MALPFAFCHSEEHSEAIINPYDCQWQSFIHLCDVGISW